MAVLVTLEAKQFTILPNQPPSIDVVIVMSTVSLAFDTIVSKRRHGTRPILGSSSSELNKTSLSSGSSIRGHLGLK